METLEDVHKQVATALDEVGAQYNSLDIKPSFGGIKGISYPTYKVELQVNWGTMTCICRRSDLEHAYGKFARVIKNAQEKKEETKESPTRSHRQKETEEEG